jgi:hypothetical protein
MTRTKKISLFDLENLSLIGNRILSEKEKASIIAGEGIDGYCYFYCMEYLTSYYGCSEMNHGSYILAYASAYNLSMGDVNNMQVTGISNITTIQEFTFNYFSTATVSMGNMSAFLNQSSGNTIMAFFSTGKNSDHAVVITGYNAQTGKYKYKDPTTGKEKELSGTAFWGGLGIAGCS